MFRFPRESESADRGQEILPNRLRQVGADLRPIESPGEFIPRFIYKLRGSIVLNCSRGFVMLRHASFDQPDLSMVAAAFL